MKQLTRGIIYLAGLAILALGITLNTVKYHIKNILQKTGYQNTLQLVAEVVEKRLILPKY